MDRFADAASRLAGIAGLTLGWRPDEFWSATPAELVAVFGALESKAAEPLLRNGIATLMEMFPDG